MVGIQNGEMRPNRAVGSRVVGVIGGRGEYFEDSRLTIDHITIKNDGVFTAADFHSAIEQRVIGDGVRKKFAAIVGHG